MEKTDDLTLKDVSVEEKNCARVSTHVSKPLSFVSTYSWPVT
jgi:hypothetical protein